MATKSPGDGGAAENRERGEALFDAGVDRHNTLQYREAVARYDEALLYWQSPKIHLYRALALSKLGEPVLAYHSLQVALDMDMNARSAERSLSPGDQERAEHLREELLRESLAVIEIHGEISDAPALAGAEIRMDGERLPDDGSSQRWVVRTGRHVVTVEKPGYFPIVENIALHAGERAEVTLTLREDQMIETRRWESWKPWAVVGAGAALGMAGGILHSMADLQLSQASVELRCEGGVGACAPQTSRRHDVAVWQNRASLGLLAASGVAVVGGAVLVYLNRSREHRSEERSKASYQLTPLVNIGQFRSTGFSARIEF